MMYQFREQDNANFSFRLLTERDLKETLSLCDECVGENLYSRDDLVNAMEAENHFFYLLTTKEDEIIGYIYYYLTDMESIAAYTKLDVELFYTVYQDKVKKVGKIQSVGIKENYRGRDISVRMIEFALEELKNSIVEMIVGVCWKMGDNVSMKKTLWECGFVYLSEAKKIWYDDTELICPYCMGRCQCDAEVYYKIL